MSAGIVFTASWGHLEGKARAVVCEVVVGRKRLALVMQCPNPGMAWNSRVRGLLFSFAVTL
jgi:hypothetical protein